MKHFRIIFTILALFFGATACMQQEKEVFESAEIQARNANGNKSITKQGLSSETTIDGAGNSGNFCYAPTNLVIVPAGSTYIIGWTAPSISTPISYTVTIMLTNSNGTSMVTTGTTTSTYVFYNFPATGTYTIYVVSNCGGGVTSNTLMGSIDFGVALHGGTSQIVVDNLDNFTPPSGTINNTSYTYSAFYASGALLNLNSIKAVFGTNLYATTSFGYSSTTNTYTFKTPTTVPQTSCTDIYGNNLIEVCVKDIYGGLQSGTYVAYCENLTSNWRVVMTPISISSNLSIQGGVIIPGLKRNKTYKMKLLSAYSPFNPYIAMNLCPQPI